MGTIDIKTATELAHRDAQSLVPIIGAGISVPLGLPNWKELITSFTNHPSVKIDWDSGDYPSHFQDIKSSIGETTFYSIIQQNLTIDGEITSTTLQALVNSGVKKIITTNLDFSIEMAFQLAGIPLEPHFIGRGYSVEELSPFFLNAASTILLKIHGSIEKPSTWVITSEDYDRAYLKPGYLKDFLVHNIQIPLFIGFSLSDFDIQECIRLSNHIKGDRSYVIMEISEANKLDQKLRHHGITPIVFHKYDQIPEIIDDIFGCKGLRVSKNVAFDQDLSINEVTIHLGAAKTLIANSMDNDTTLNTMLDILGNAFEFQPLTSILDDLPRRRTGPKNDYKNKLKSLFSKRDFEIVKVLFNAFTYYPDLLIDGVLASLLDSPKTDYYSFLELLFSVISSKNPKLVYRVEKSLLSSLKDSSLGYQVRRDITKVLSKRGIHPGVLIPPRTILINKIYVPIYPLTRYQVGRLRGNKMQFENPSVQAYTIDSLDEIPDILGRLSAITGNKWRLPTKWEWLMFSSISKTGTWPWGSQNPEYHRHAHLKYFRKSGEIPHRPLEVGLFPEGVSELGLFDLIGNVYEVVTAYGDFELAGGSWSTKFDYNHPNYFSVISRWGRGKSNVGIRPIYEHESS